MDRRQDPAGGRGAHAIEGVRCFIPGTPDFECDDGDYKLVVTIDKIGKSKKSHKSKKGQKNRVTYDLTIGAVGPPGADFTVAGPPGPTGPSGALDSIGLLRVIPVTVFENTIGRTPGDRVHATVTCDPSSILTRCTGNCSNVFSTIKSSRNTVTLNGCPQLCTADRSPAEAVPNDIFATATAFCLSLQQ